MIRLSLLAACFLAASFVQPAIQGGDPNGCECQAELVPASDGFCSCTFFSTLLSVGNAPCFPPPDCEPSWVAGCVVEFAEVGYDCGGTTYKREDVTLFAPCNYSDRVVGTCPTNPESFTGWVLRCGDCEEL